MKIYGNIWKIMKIYGNILKNKKEIYIYVYIYLYSFISMYFKLFI